MPKIKTKDAREILHRRTFYNPDSGLLIWKDGRNKGKPVAAFNQTAGANGYYVRVDGCRMPLLHAIYIYHGGAITRGQTIVPLDGDYTNSRIQNLFLTTVGFTKCANTHRHVIFDNTRNSFYVLAVYRGKRSVKRKADTLYEAIQIANETREQLYGKRIAVSMKDTTTKEQADREEIEIRNKFSQTKAKEAVMNAINNIEAKELKMSIAAESNKTKTRATPVNLTMKQSAVLCNLIEAEYVQKGLTDSEFAKYAAEKLGFTVLNTHIAPRRDEYGIPSFTPKPALAIANKSMLARVEYLEKLLNHLYESLGAIKPE